MAPSSPLLPLRIGCMARTLLLLLLLLLLRACDRLGMG